ncbi:hypothetical protein [Treponema primitia]|uniref:hypothetical protein n=1 Tax=Treponema primitia TaxID=88058 RepID=UPI000255545C|nr:hypothetical protein [Treponema primitia]
MKPIYIVILLLSVPCCFAADFGLVLNTVPEYGYAGQGADSGGDFSFTGTASPWVSGVLREDLSYYLSGRLLFEYEDGEAKTPLLVELERTEFDWRPFSAVFVSAGRQHFADSAALIASGFFDGLLGSLSLQKARLSAGVFYTGFLYKESAEIIMSAVDMANYSKPLDYGDGDSYRASRRLLAELTGEFPDLTSRTSLTVNALGQFDLTSQDALHSQYLLGHYFFTPIEVLRLNLAASVGFTETDGVDLRTSLAFQAGAEWNPPGSLEDMADLRFRWASGAISDTIGVFLPLNGIIQGEIFMPRISSLLSVKAAYTARLHEQVSVSAGTTYFIRTDTETFNDADLDPQSSSLLLGGELYGSVIWAIDSILRFTAGGGAFFPQWGGAFAADTPLRWKVNAGVTVSL